MPLFVGPREDKCILDWVFLFGINNKNNLYSQMNKEFSNAETEEYEDEEDKEIYYFNDLYLFSEQVGIDFKILNKKLSELKLDLVDFTRETYKIGKKIELDYNSPIEPFNTIIQDSKNLWLEYGIDNIHLFEG